MTGVEILNATEIIDFAFSTEIAIIILIGNLVLANLIAFILMQTSVPKDKSWFIILNLIGCFLGIVTGYAVAQDAEKVPTGKYEYQVIINENVKLNEFLESYVIIKQEGKIYTVVEK